MENLLGQIPGIFEQEIPPGMGSGKQKTGGLGWKIRRGPKTGKGTRKIQQPERGKAGNIPALLELSCHRLQPPEKSEELGKIGELGGERRKNSRL